MQARDLMTSPVITVRPEATIGAAARLMLEHDVSCLPVVDEAGKLVGIVTHTDFGLHPRHRALTTNVYGLLGAAATPQHLEEVSRQVARRPIKDVMHRRVVTVSEDAAVAEVVDQMLHRDIHRVPVMRGEELVGIITRHDFLKLIVANS